MKSIVYALLLATASVSVTATDFPLLERKPILDVPVPAANPPITLIRGASIRFAPGQPTGVHLHPASTVGVVTEGSFVFQPDGEPSRVLHTGDSFFEPAGHEITHFDNASATEPAAITVFYLTDSESRPLIKLLGDK